MARLDPLGLPERSEPLTSEHLTAEKLYNSAEAIRVHLLSAFGVDHHKPIRIRAAHRDRQATLTKGPHGYTFTTEPDHE